MIAKKIEPKPRLILAHVNAEALRQDSPVIEVEHSLSAFVKRIRGFQHGREIRAFKDQLSRLSVSLVRLATTRGDRAFQINAQVVTAFGLWPDPPHDDDALPVSGLLRGDGKRDHRSRREARGA